MYHASMFKNRIRWRCTAAKGTRCKTEIYTDLELQFVIFDESLSPEHSCRKDIHNYKQVGLQFFKVEKQSKSSNATEEIKEEPL